MKKAHDILAQHSDVQAKDLITSPFASLSKQSTNQTQGVNAPRQYTSTGKVKAFGQDGQTVPMVPEVHHKVTRVPEAARRLAHGITKRERDKTTL